MEDFKKLILKYYKNDFFDKKIVLQNSTDVSNTLFRYPATKKKIDLSILNEITIKDVELIRNLFDKLEFQSKWSKHAKKWNWPKEKIKEVFYKDNP